MGRFNVWDYGARPGTDCTAAFNAAKTAALASGPGDHHLIMPYGDEGDYYLQYKASNGQPVAGYMHFQVATGIYLHGDEGTPLVSLPASMGGQPGQMVGVRLSTTQSVSDCGFIGVVVKNNGVATANPNYHGFFFHNSGAAGPTITNLTLENCKADGVAYGDGFYFGSGVSSVHVSGGKAINCHRYGMCLAASGAGRSNYIVQDMDLDEGGSSHAFHVESSYDIVAAKAAVDAGKTQEEIFQAMNCVRGVSFERCHFAGTFALNGVADWSIKKSTFRPKTNGPGGALIVSSAPKGLVDDCVLVARPSTGTNEVKLIELLGFLSDDITFTSTRMFLDKAVDGSLPTSAIYSRQYSSTYPGWPDRLKFDAAFPSLLVKPSGTLVYNTHQGTGWDLSGLKTVDVP